MALYKYANELTKTDSSEFDVTYKPGAATPHSGIYVCVNCRDEIAANKGNPLPPQNHRQHKTSIPPIEWQLLLKTQPGPQ